MINSLDLWVFAMSLFQISPYDSVNILTTPTVQGRDDTGSRCGLGISMSTWMNAIATNECVTNGAVGRRLSDNIQSLDAQINTYQVFALGRWLKITIPHIFWAVELHLKNIEIPMYVTLSHMFDINSPPRDFNHAQIMYRRLNVNPQCAPISASVFGNIAMIHNSIQIAQYGNFPCEFDIFLWVPREFDKPIHILSTSSAMNGMGGAFQMYDIEEQGLFKQYEVGIRADPHLMFAHGGTADMRGTHLGIYNIVSSHLFNMNVQFEDATFLLKRNTIHGSFVTNAFIVTDEIKLSYEGFRKQGIAHVHCDDKLYIIRRNKQRTCGSVKSYMNYSSLHVETPEWFVHIHPKPVFDHISGPTQRLDITIQNKIPIFNMRHTPHGLLGQSFTHEMAVFGLTENFNENPYTTKYMAEGAIEGYAHDYLVTHAYETNFTFSRFHTNGNNKPVTDGLRLDLL